MGMLKQKFTVDPLSMEDEELNENFAENYYYGEDEDFELDLPTEDFSDVDRWMMERAILDSDSCGLEEAQLDLKEEG